jgi:hypothetical protein
MLFSVVAIPSSGPLGKLRELLVTLCIAGCLTITSRAAWGAPMESDPGICSLIGSKSARPPFTLSGLTNPAVVAETIFVSASAVPPGASVAFCIDGVLHEVETRAPYWLGGEKDSTPVGFPVTSLHVDRHELKAIAILGDGSHWPSQPLTLQVIASANAQFSPTLAAYANQPGAQATSVSSVLKNTSTAGALLSPVEAEARQSILALYLNWGIDPSLDFGNDQSPVLLSLLPRSWAPPESSSSSRRPSMRFSTDAPFYHPIPANWPRVVIPAGYFHHVQLSTSREGDGIGYGQVTAVATDPQLTIKSQWHANAATHREFAFRFPVSWAQSLPAQTAGDSHMVFIDPVARTFVSSYKTSIDPESGAPIALYASSPTPFNTLGDHGGSTASGFAELPLLIQPGEATNPTEPISHAIGGPLGRTWAARVYPATAWDSGVKASTNSCTHIGLTNTGLVPYGGVIQLDPHLDLASLHLSLPALRILQAMQTYGYYVMDFGCADFDIYTTISGAELEPYGGLWGYNKRGAGVQNEIERIITTR